MKRVLPGFGLSLGFTLVYLAACPAATLGAGFQGQFADVGAVLGRGDRRTGAGGHRVTFGASLLVL